MIPFPFENPIMNAAGPLDVSLEELDTLAKSDAGAVVMKSATRELREGNLKPRWSPLKHGGLQSMGLPNHGYKAYLEYAKELKQRYPEKNIIASVSGLCTDHNLEMIQAFNQSDADIIELNVSCPNVPGKSQVGYDFEQTEYLFQKLSSIRGKTLGVKLPPYMDRVHVNQMAELLKKYEIDFISTINSIGNCFVVDAENETPLIKSNGGFGGLSGEYIKPVALGNVRMFYEALQGTDISIIGVGGIKTGKDVFEFLLAGADLVQTGTTFLFEGPECFAKMKAELNEILTRKGYKNYQEAVGALKPFTREALDTFDEQL